VFNNKGKPVRQYEPFFSSTHLYEEDREMTDTGVSPILFYDPVERMVAMLHPNHSYQKVVFDPWQQTSYDVNDTVTFNPRTDDDIKDFFTRLPTEEYLPTWFDLRTDPAHVAEAAAKWPDPKIRAAEQDAAEKAAKHADTPAIACFDSLGRPFLTVAHNRFERNGITVDEHSLTRVELDIEGNQRAVIDANDRVVMRYDYDMLGTRIHQASMEAGNRWTLNDVAGKSIYAWNSRDHTFRIEYDALRRPTGIYLRDSGGPELLVQHTIYGEGQGDSNNHRMRVYQVYDGAGVIASDEYDFKGNLRRSSRTLAGDYTKIYDWNNDTVQPSWEIFFSSTTYDALNRPVAVITPDNSVYRPTFNEANLLERLDVNLRNAAVATPFVANIDYNAKGQRELIEYENGASTSYEYDPDTFRLTNLKTTRPANLGGLATQLFKNPGTVQDLHYTYDPAGNITRIADDALKTIFFNGQQVDPICKYTCDAIYRLIETTGREHIGQTAHDFNPQNRRDYDFVGLADFIGHPNDVQTLRQYTESYDYDEVGNFKSMRHTANGGSWTRTYEYDEDSLIETGKKSNRLTRTTVGNGLDHIERYTHDIHGNMTAMPHLPHMDWNFRDQLQHLDLGGGGEAYYVYDAGGQRVRKVVEKNGGTIIEERVYLGGFEIFRRRNGVGAVTLERETLHIMDDQQRIALIETKTIDASISAASLPETLIRYQVGNHLGSASLELDDQAQIISYEEYYPYGSTSYQAGQSAAEVSLKRYRYTGMERDEESGLNYHGARYYVAWIGRWMSCDPSGLSGGLNLYCYGANSPVIFVDTSGNEPESLTFPLPEQYQMRKGRYIGNTQTLPPPGASKRRKGSGAGRRDRSTSSGGQEGKEAGLEGGVGGSTSTATKFATAKYVEEGAGDGRGGLGEPTDVGSGNDSGGTSKTPNTESGTGEGSDPGTLGGTGKTKGSSTTQGKESRSDRQGQSGAGEDSAADRFTQLASLIVDPESLYRAKEVRTGDGSPIGNSLGIIGGWLAKVVTWVVAFGAWALRVIRAGIGKLKSAVGGIRNKLARLFRKPRPPAGGGGFTHEDVRAAMGRLDEKGIKASDAQGHIDPDNVVDIAEKMKSGEFQNELMDQPVIRDSVNDVQLSGHHRTVAAEMTDFPLEVKKVPVGATGQEWKSVPVKPGRRKR
jgi:RHS repeat-associated protein